MTEGFWKSAFETLARMHGYGRAQPSKPEWRTPRCYELLFLPPPPRQLLLAPPSEITIGSFVRFKESYLRSLQGTSNYHHWARSYGNGVGIVRNIKVWGGKHKTTVQIDFPHRMECHYLADVELDHRAVRAMAMLKWGPMYGPEIRLARAENSTPLRAAS